MIRILLVSVWFILFAVLTLPILLILLIVSIFDRKTSEKLAKKCIRFMMGVLLWLTGTTVTVKGKENIPEGEPVLFVPNHRSYFDFIVTFLNIPDLCYVGKKELGYIPVFGQWVWLLGTLLLDRGNRKEGYRIIEKAAKEVKEDRKCIAIFPEGTRNKGTLEEPLRFREGSLKISTWSGCKMVPVAILGTRDIYENHRPWIRPGKVTLIFGTPVDPASLSEEELKTYGARTRETIIRMILEEEGKSHG